MAEELTLVPLEKIWPNPYQPRSVRNAEKVESLARSIAADRLLQPPMARQVADEFQLAFGHTRFEAFVFLNEQTVEWFTENGWLDKYGYYSQMPLVVADLSDEDMFRYANAENAQREDIGPIDEAKSMKRALVEFKYTSRQVGELFGKSESTVRGAIRLLDLPESLQAQVNSGEMTVGAARKILSVRHLVENMEELVTSRFSTARTVDEIVQDKIDNQAIKLHTMWQRWNSDEKPRGGPDLWELSWTYKVPPYHMPTEKEFLKIWNGPKEISGRAVEDLANDFYRSIATIQPHLRKTWEQLYAENKPEVYPVLDLVKQLAEPPACTACQFYVRNDGNHLCALKACWERKFAEFTRKELEALSKKTGIPVYRPGEDGRTVIRLESSHDAEERRWFEARHEGLRLQVRQSSWKHAHTDSLNVCVLMTGAEAERIKAAEARAKKENSQEDYSARWKRDNQKRDLYVGAVQRFVLEQVCPTFASALEGKLAGALLDDLARRTHYTLPDKMPPAQKVVYNLVWSMHAVDGEARQTDAPLPVGYAAKHLQGVAKAWGVKLPPDWMDIAARYEPDLSEFPECCVSTETPVEEVAA